MAISLSKISEAAPSLLKTAEIAVNTIDKARLNGQTAKVAVVLDYSGSMSSEYRSGRMQKLVEKVLALGTQFDDDGAIDFFVFDTSAAYLGEVSISNFKGSVSRLTEGRAMSITNYHEAFWKVHEHFAAPVKKSMFNVFKKNAAPAPADQPVYVLFLTDGDPTNPEEAVRALINISTSPIFWKFLSIGDQKIDFLQNLDDLTDRAVDNADYQHIGDLDRIEEAKLFDLMLEEFPEWLTEVRNMGMIK